MSRHRSSSKRPPPEIGLHMECEEEELEPSQVAYYNKAEKEYNEIQAKVDNYIKKMKAEVVEKGENCLVLQLNASPQTASSPSTPSTGSKATRQSVQTSQNYQQIPGQGIMTRSNSSAATNTYLVMDPRLGFMVSQVQSSNTATEQVTTSTPSKTVPSGRTRQQATTTGTVMVTTRAKSNLKKQSSSTTESETLTTPVTRTRQQEKSKNQAQQSPPQASAQVFSAGSGTCSPGNYKIKVNAKPANVQPGKPNESNAVGGLSAGGKAFKSTGDDSSSSKSAADSREVTFSKLTGKIFPSLVVVARPHLKLKYIPQSSIQQKRCALDSKVKGVLMYTSTKFIEWLIQQGLIRSEQSCQIHVNNDLTPVKLKLGMYSDVSKFPYSGGYVWISDCCPQQFVSVFSGSIFEGAPHPPTTLLKLIYHWACQTNVQNVVQWVKVDNLYLKNFYTNMRAVCTQAVHEKFKKLGGPRKKIEVGVISLGTTSQDDNKRQVKVEVLGVMDQENKVVRLRAVEPLSEERSFKRRFVKILEPLEDWVHKDSVILTDFTVAKAALNAMGFNSVYQVTNDSKLSNQNIMEYLRRIVPRMFQNTLSLLSRQIIQQFLDELVWREMWGPIPPQAFVTIILHLAEQTKLDVAENFLVRLNKVAANPFKNWNYSCWKPLAPGTTRTGSRVQQKSPASSQEFIPEVTVETLETPVSGKGIRTRKRAAEQPLSETVTPPTSAKKVAKVSGKEKQKKEEKAIKKELIDKIPEEVMKFINEGEQISLENYYYASKEGDYEIGHSATGAFNVKCCVCNKRFTDNVVLMKHMILHCQVQPPLTIDLKKVHQCGSCFLGFNTGAALKAHLQEVHYEIDGKIETNLLCHICEVKFIGRVELIYHMHRTHVALEMPYECGGCGFRTSVYKVFVDHFVQVHKNEDHVFCPYCLKLVTFSYKGEPITTNILFYMSHLEKHQRLTLVKDCNRCQLSFIHKGILDQHVEADHGSWKGETGVTPIDYLPTGILMPEPGSVIKTSPVVKPFKSPKTKNMFAMNKFKSLEVNGLDENMSCVECESSLTFSEHFTGNFNCLKCRYASCCEKAMVEHFAVFHETTHPQFTKGKPIVLPQEMFCVCGYSTSSGNRIAKHLASCERESAYASKEAAFAAVQSKEVADFETPSKLGEGQNVLNMLGLVRKSPEATSTGGSESVKMETEEEEEDDLGADSEVKREAPEITATFQEESDTSESQQELSVIARTLNPPKTPKNAEDEQEPERNETVEKVYEVQLGPAEKKQVDAKEKQVHAEEKRVDAEEKQVHAEEKRVDAEEKQVHAEEKRVDAEEKQVHAEEKEVDAEEKEVDAEEKEVDAEEKEVDAEEKEVDAEEKEVDAEEKEVDAVEKVVDAEEKEVDAEEKEVDAEEKEVDAEEKVVNAEDKEVDAEEKEVDAEEKEVDAEDKEVDAEDKEVDAEEKEVDAEEKVVDAEEKEVDAEEKEVVHDEEHTDFLETLMDISEEKTDAKFSREADKEEKEENEEEKVMEDKEEDEEEMEIEPSEEINKEEVPESQQLEESNTAIEMELEEIETCDVQDQQPENELEAAVIEEGSKKKQEETAENQIETMNFEEDTPKENVADSVPVPNGQKNVAQASDSPDL